MWLGNGRTCYLTKLVGYLLLLKHIDWISYWKWQSKFRTVSGMIICSISHRATEPILTLIMLSKKLIKDNDLSLSRLFQILAPALNIVVSIYIDSHGPMIMNSLLPRLSVMMFFQSHSHTQPML